MITNASLLEIIVWRNFVKKLLGYVKIPLVNFCNFFLFSQLNVHVAKEMSF